MPTDCPVHFESECVLEDGHSLPHKSVAEAAIRKECAEMVRELFNEMKRSRILMHIDRLQELADRMERGVTKGNRRKV